VSPESGPSSHVPACANLSGGLSPAGASKGPNESGRKVGAQSTNPVYLPQPLPNLQNVQSEVSVYDLVVEMVSVPPDSSSS
jgi:hypothetical protein